MLGYGMLCYALIDNIIKNSASVTFGIWGLPLVILGVGEYLRFKKVESGFAEKLKFLSRKQGLHYSYEAIAKTLPNYSAKEVFSNNSLVKKIYRKKDSLILHIDFEDTDSFEITPEDFDVTIKLISGTADILHKQHFTNLGYKDVLITAQTSFTVCADKGSKLEFNLHKRN